MKIPSPHQEKAIAINIPSFFPGGFFDERAKDILNKSQKTTISGTANISAKLFFLTHLLKETPYFNIFFVFEEKNQLHEAFSIAPLFFQAKKNTYTFHHLPISETEEKEREKEKTEWAHALLQEGKKQGVRIFFAQKKTSWRIFRHHNN